MMLDNKHRYVSWIRGASINASRLSVSKESAGFESLRSVENILIYLGDRTRRHKLMLGLDITV